MDERMLVCSHVYIYIILIILLLPIISLSIYVIDTCLYEGLLAPLNGSERYLSVACGHTAAFFRAALHACRTPQASIADSSGVLSVQALSRNDPELEALFQRGWAWTVLPWQVESTWPRLPDLAQRALNASNSVATLSSELETASTIAEFAAMQAAMGQDVDWTKCADATAQSAPQSREYVEVITTYVKLYGGGPSAPMVKYLDRFAKVYGESRTVGQEFFQTVTNAQFASMSKKCPPT